MIGQTQKTFHMELKITKIHDNPSAANGYVRTAGNIKPIGETYHLEEFLFTIGSIKIGRFVFKNNKCSDFTLNTSNTLDDDLDVYFLLKGKSFDEIVTIVNKWLN